MKKYFIGLFSIAIMFFFLAACQEKAEKSDSFYMYVASDNPEDAAIGIFEWNPKTAELKSVSVDSTLATSSYLAIDSTTSRLYSISQEVISAYKIEPETGGLTLLNKIPITGRGACYVSISNDHKYLIVGYYSSGSLASYNLKEDGSIGSHVSGFEHRGTSINAERQERAHVHMVYPVPQSNLILVPDLGIYREN
jgi:6-phosphogluconolactonase